MSSVAVAAVSRYWPAGQTVTGLQTASRVGGAASTAMKKRGLQVTVGSRGWVAEPRQSFPSGHAVHALEVLSRYSPALHFAAAAVSQTRLDVAVGAFFSN